MTEVKIRTGEDKDAGVLREVFELASHGLSPYLWQKGLQPGQNYDQSVAARMIAKIRDPEQLFRIADIEGEPAGGALTYRISRHQPLNGGSAMTRAFNEVDNRLLGTVYVNAIAVFPDFRRAGIASALLRDAKDAAARTDHPISLSVSDANPDAVSTYEANGFHHVGKVRMEKEDWPGEGENWLLMVNDNTCQWHQPDRTHCVPSQRTLSTG